MNNDQDQDDEEEQDMLHNNDNIEDDDQPLYQDAGITVRGSMLIILTLLLVHHNLTMTCIEDIIFALQLHCLQKGLQKYINYFFVFGIYINSENILIKLIILLNITIASFALEN